VLAKLLEQRTLIRKSLVTGDFPSVDAPIFRHAALRRRKRIRSSGPQNLADNRSSTTPPSNLRESNWTASNDVEHDPGQSDARDLEREFDRLSRLLRRAAELDVTGCCNDVRTLLVARCHSEALSVVTTTPTLQRSNCLISRRVNTELEEIFFSLYTPPLPLIDLSHLRSPNVVSTILQLSYYIHVFQPGSEPKLIPDIAELAGALAVVKAGTCHSTGAHNMLDSAAMAIVHVCLGDLLLFLASGNCQCMSMLPSLNLNQLTWRALASLLMLVRAFRELGFADSEILSEVCGIGGWVSKPNADSVDHSSLLVAKARVLSSADRETTYRPKTDFYFRISVPRSDSNHYVHRCFKGSKSDSEDHKRGSAERMPALPCKPCTILCTQFKEQPRFRNSSVAVGTWCQNALDLISNHSDGFIEPDASCCKSTRVLHSITDMRDAFNLKTLSGSFADFVLDTRQILEKYDGFRSDEIPAMSKLRMIFERFLREKNFDTSTIPNSSNVCGACGLCLCDSTSKLVYCHRCHACYHQSCSKSPSDQTWFCPSCISLGDRSRVINGMMCRPAKIHGAICTIQYILTPGFNTFASSPQLVLRRKDGRSMTIDTSLDPYACSLEISDATSPRGGGLSNKLDPEQSPVAANKAAHSLEFKTLIHAIQVLSNDGIWNDQDWVDVFASLLVCAPHKVERDINSLDRRNAPNYFLLNENRDLDSIRENIRRRQDVLLIAGVVRNTVSFVKSDQAVNLQLKANVHKLTRQDFLPICRPCPVQTFGTEISCMCCGSDYNSLQSEFVNAQPPLKMGTVLLEREPPQWALVHEFCSNSMIDQLGDELNHKRQAAGDERTSFASKGRPLGIDLCGRIYWHFLHCNNMLAVQLVVSHGNQINTEQWSCFCTIPLIAQLMLYLIELCDVEVDILLNKIMSTFPEACTLLEPDRAIQFLTYDEYFWLHLEAVASSSGWQASTVAPHFQDGDGILVRVSELVCSANIETSAEKHDILYSVGNKGWNPVLDTQICAESILCNSDVACAVQFNLYSSRVSHYGDYSVSNQLHLIASSFMGKPYRVSAHLPDMLAAKLEGDTSKYMLARLALLTVNLALPRGSLAPAFSSSVHLRASVCRMNAYELTELVLALEDSINKLWLRSSWSTIRACLPTRAHFLKYASLSNVALLLWILDRGIIYDLIEE